MINRTIVALLVLSLVVTPVGLTVAQQGEYVSGQPNLDVFVPEPDVAPGSSTQLTLQVTNNGEVDSGAATQRDVVTTARGVTVAVTDAGPFDVSTQRQPIGSVRDGEVRNAPISITVPEHIEPGEYTLNVRLRYTYTDTYAPDSAVVQERTQTVRTSVDVVVTDGAQFTLRTVGSDAQVGERGDVRVAVANVGNEPARDVTLELESTTTDVLLGDNTRNTARIDRLDPGENATVTLHAVVRPDVSVRNVTLAGAIRFTDQDGIEASRTGLSTGLRPIAEQDFTLTVDESTLRVGELGTINGTITNRGTDTINSVVLSLREPPFEPRSLTYAVGDLDPGESTSFQFRGVVPSTSDAVPRRLDVTVGYRTAAGTDRTTTEPIRVAVADRRDAVRVTPINATFGAGETGTLELDVTNQRDSPISDVRVHLVVEAPLESDFRTTVVPHLRPGETDRVAFDLEVDGEAPVSRYPATVEVKYTDANGEPAVARSSTVAIDVTDSETTLPVSEIGATIVVLLLVGVGGWWFYGRRLV
jgi:hypothetical protein